MKFWFFHRKQYTIAACMEYILNGRNHLLISYLEKLVKQSVFYRAWHS